jgi:hypothetical protein
MSDPAISTTRVEEILVDCLYNSDEVSGDSEVPEGAVTAEGILRTYAFHPERLESHREEITAMLKELPEQFKRSGGGGWSFLNACDDRNGVQWTGLHLRMEQLFCLGIGLDLVAWALPRDMWAALPGGMPYVVVKL